MTAKRANKPQRLSTLPATLAFNDYSDYEGAPESSDFRALPHRLSTLRLCPSDFGAGRHTHPEAPAERSGRPPQKIGRPTPNTPGPPPAMPGPGPPTAAPEAPRREHRRPDMQAQPPRERPTDGHRKRHTRERRGRKRHTQAQDGRRTKEK